MASFKDHFVKEQANAGIKMPVCLPDGTKTKDWLTVLGTDSDKFKLIEADLREVFLSPTATNIDKEDAKIKVVAACIGNEWSFDEECSEENKIDLLKNAPHIYEQINQLAADRMNYIKKK